MLRRILRLGLALQVGVCDQWCCCELARGYDSTWASSLLSLKSQKIEKVTQLLHAGPQLWRRGLFSSSLLFRLNMDFFLTYPSSYMVSSLLVSSGQFIIAAHSPNRAHRNKHIQTSIQSSLYTH